MPPASALLRQCDQPIAFDGLVVGKQDGIGRAQSLDNADSAQKSDPAALCVRRPSGPISR